jgi:hypothetical protein
MTGAASLAFPGGRKLAGWWRQLAAYEPLGLWVGHLLLHHVEAAVRVSQPRRLDPLNLFLLRALALPGPPVQDQPAPPEAVLDRLNSWLHVGRQVLRQALRELEAEGLAGADEPGRWTPTALGRQALEHQEYPRARYERRAFHFLDRRAAGEKAESLPHFLDVRNFTGIPWPAAEGAAFDVRTLQACVHQPAEWKQQHGFPLDVQEILAVDLGERETGSDSAGEKIKAADISNPTPSALPSWQRVIVDRPEHILAVLVLARSPSGQQIVGLAVRQDGWVLQTATPLFTLSTNWTEVFPELAAEPPLEVWRQAWRAWCEPRAVPAAEINACRVESHGERLRVTGPPGLVERLRTARSDVFKGETWLLAGDGPVRAAAQVELTEG